MVSLQQAQLIDDAVELGKQDGCLGRLPRHPTIFMPGTKGKIAIMMRRCERGESLFHAADPDLAVKRDRLQKIITTPCNQRISLDSPWQAVRS